MDHPESRQYSDYREGWSGRESERKFFLQVRVCSQISPPVNGFRVKKGQVEYIKSQTRTSLIETPTKRLYLTINLMFLFWVQLIAVQGTVWQQRPLVSPSSFIQVWDWHCDSEKMVELFLDWLVWVPIQEARILVELHYLHSKFPTYISTPKYPCVYPMYTQKPPFHPFTTVNIKLTYWLASPYYVLQVGITSSWYLCAQS